MFFISKLVLIIILLNETYAYITQDTEIILLPALYPIGARKIPLSLKVFGQLIQLNLRRNDRIVSPALRIWKYNSKSVTEKLLKSNVSNHCHYYHKDHISFAAVHFCHEHGLEGLAFVKNNRLEIRPLQNKFTTLYFIDNFKGQTNLSFGKPYVIKKSLQYFTDSNFYNWDKFKLKRRHVRNAQQNLTMELAVFLDEAAYNRSKLFVWNEDMLHTMVLVYVSRIQDAFNNSNLNVFINITLTRLNILKKQPSNLSLSDGDADRLLDSFCKYANSLNVLDDNDQHQWDINLYLTGVKLYEEYLKNVTTLSDDEVHYKTEKNYNITGKTYHDGACKLSLSCAIVEFRNHIEILTAVDAVRKISNLLGLTQKRSSSNSEMNVTSEDNREWQMDKMEKLWERKRCLRDKAETMISKKEKVDHTKNLVNIKLAVFFDNIAYHMYMPILNNNEKRLREMILAYVNQIQALFHHSSFGASANILLVELEIIKIQPSNLSVDTNTDAEVLLSSFCRYAYYLKDKNRSHWDIALYLTGTDLYKMENEKKNYSPLGRSNFKSICSNNTLSCGIVEFSTTSLKSFSGFQTARTAAHEIGHILGIQHDSEYIDIYCLKNKKFDKYIMTEVRLRRGQITWSECTRNVVKELWETQSCFHNLTRRGNLEDNLNHSHYHNLPGREWTAKAQCQLFLRDKDANVVTLLDICQVLQCETPHQDKYFFVGPALDGTYCAFEKECRGGECVPVIEKILPHCAHDNWGKWKEDSCKSNCLSESKGVIIKRRFCKHETYKTASCSGPYYDVVLCDDSSLCTGGREMIVEYATKKCNELKSKIKKARKYFQYEPENRPGRQESHDVEKPWIACTTFCQRKENISATDRNYHYYTPRQEMLELGMDPYFPDGTWCHSKDDQNYYCRQHYCMPENDSNKK